MTWQRTTTTSETSPDTQPGPPEMPPAPAGGVVNSTADVGRVINRTPEQYAQPNVPIVPAPVASVTDGGMANVATADGTFQPDVRRSYNLMRITQFIWLIAGVLETLFAVRVVLRLLNANPSAGFDQFITNTTGVFLAPFAGLMTNAGAANGSVLEVTTIIAMIIYALLAWGIVRLLWIVFERRIVR